MSQDRKIKHKAIRRSTTTGRFMVCAVALVFALTRLALFSAVARAADEDRGKDIFERRCTGCHSLDKDKEGPRLRGVYGRTSGSVPSFTYSDNVKTANITWDAASLDKWLTDPHPLIPEPNIAFT